MSKQIPLTNGGYALVDDEDFERVSQFLWHQALGYAIRPAHKRKGETGNVVRMHAFVLGVPRGTGIDHINRDRLDNRKGNLRLASPSQNSANRQNSGLWKGKKIVSPYKGVTWSRSMNCWQARLGYQRRQIFLGYHASEIEAARAYNKAASEYFGEFASLNIIPTSKRRPTDEPIGHP